MKASTLIYIGIIWLLLNAIFPIVLNAIERLYQPRIDTCVETSLRILRILILGLLQVLLIAFFAPNILLIGIVERVYPGFFELGAIKKTGIYPAMHSVLRKALWPLIAADVRKIRSRNTKSLIGVKP